MKKQLLLLLLLATGLGLAFAKPEGEDLESIRKQKRPPGIGRFSGCSLLTGTWEQACIQMVKTLVKSPEDPGSFDYPFDSVPTVSIVYRITETFASSPADGIEGSVSPLFRCYPDAQRFNWCFSAHRYEYVHSGIDSVILDQDNWFGQLYYDVQEFKFKKKDTICFLAGMQMTCGAIKDRGCALVR